MESTTKKIFEILLVEDNEAHADLAIECMEDSPFEARVRVAKDGIQAMEVLRQESADEPAYRPDIVLLDLNLPKMGGRDVLAAIKSDPELQSIPVMILSTSADEGDIKACYELNAACYLTKPIDLPDFHDMMQCLEKFWFATVKLPPN